MFLSNLRVIKLRSFGWYLLIFLGLGLSDVHTLAKGLHSAPYILGRVNSHSPLFEDISTLEMEASDPDRKGFTLRKAFTPSVDFNVEILCRWKSFYRIRILAGENTYLISGEDLMFIGENIAQLNDKIWQASQQESPLALGLDQELLSKIEACIEEDTLFTQIPEVPPAPSELVAELDPAKEGPLRGESKPNKYSITYGLHKVKEGESLKSIASTYNISVMDILSINDLDSQLIKIGQMIRIPRNKVAQSSPSSFAYHKVKKGETLWRIATNHSVSIDRLRRVNDLSSNTIYQGQRLKIPLN